MSLDLAMTNDNASRVHGQIEASAVEVAERAATPCEVAPYALLRLAALPVAELEALRPIRCLAALARAEAAATEMAAVADVLTDDLFALVSRIEAGDKRYRRVVLQLKRKIHNAEAATSTEEVFERIVGDIDADAAQRLARWHAAQCERTQALAEADTAFAEEIAGILRPRLRALLRRSAFRHALALAAPGVLAHGARERQYPDRPTPNNFERSLLGYAIRATAKTSPFSSFMSTTVLDVTRGVPDTLALTDLRLHCRTRLSRGVIARIDAAAAPHLRRPLSVNPTLIQVGPKRFRTLCDRLLVVLGRPWRQQSRTHFQLHDTLSRVLLSGAPPAPAPEWRERFVAAGVEPARALDLVPQLLERGMLVCAAASDAFVEAPEVTLRHELAANGDFALAEAAHCIDGMITECARMSAQGSADVEASARAESVERIRMLEAEALAQFGVTRGDPLQNVVVEDAWSTGVSAAEEGAGRSDAIQDLAGFLSTQVGVSSHYQRLRSSFIARFGEGGHCNDVLDFLCESVSSLVTPLEYGKAQEEESVVRASPGARLPVTIQAQAIASGSGPQLVVNKVFENMGWLAARFAVGNTPEHAWLREGLERWLVQVAGDREPVDVPVSGECNDLQAHPRLTRRVLRVPGEPLSGAGILELRDLRLRDLPECGELVLSDRDGCDLHACYLGGTLATPSWGVPYALAVLGQPYQLIRPTYQPPTWSNPTGIEFVPRMCAGRVVVRRAMWWISTEYLRRVWFSTQGALRLAAVRGECRAMGLPEAFFVRRPIRSSGDMVSSNALDANRKPLWVDVGNPFCLALLERLCDGVEWISFSEALPATGDGWLRSDGAPHVSELQFELLLLGAGG